MTLQQPPTCNVDAPIWTIFCKAVDNFGDIGVCWRLAKQLHQEFGIHVELWVDDWDALAVFLQAPILRAQDTLTHNDVHLRRWPQPWPDEHALDCDIARSAVVIEAFACALPVGVQRAIATSNPPPLWLNLEYLSAEDWVGNCHGLPSPQAVPCDDGSRLYVQKYFFFPGFRDNTGGLLRETALLEQHRVWQNDLRGTRAQALAALSVPEPLLSDPDCLFLSLFCYESPSVQSLLRALAESAEPSVCLVPEGRAVSSVKTFFGLDETPLRGSCLQRGALSLVILPFSSQTDYDRLLSLCDFNIVRGEDSFVRAQWAARPLLWHLYPQEGNAHLPKMEAFLALYSGSGMAEGRLPELWRCWNQGEDCREIWHHLRPQLPALQRQARNWQEKLAEMPDLAANLLAFYRTHRDEHAKDCSAV